MSEVEAASSDTNDAGDVPSLQPNSVLVRVSDLPDAKLSDNEIVILHLDQQKYYGVSGPGARIWELLESKLTFDELCARLTEDFDVDINECSEQTREFVGDLLQEKLVTIVSQS